MIASVYLEMLDLMFQPGLNGLGTRFVELQTRFVETHQQPDGGFAGRQGGSDLYYTDFALRTLAWLAPHDKAIEQTLEYLSKTDSRPRDVVECFNRLNGLRLIERNMMLMDDRVRDKLVTDSWAVLQQYGLSSGGIARRPGTLHLSVYNTFLGYLCFEMLGEPIPNAQKTMAIIRSLQGTDGGFSESTNSHGSQVNATAAAVALLILHNAIDAEQAAAARYYLAAMQAEDGGFLAHDAAPTSDLLSTFTALVTLTALDGISGIAEEPDATNESAMHRADNLTAQSAPQAIGNQVDWVATARFLRSMAMPSGGFCAHSADTQADLEYTYYGIASMALLRGSIKPSKT